MDAVATQPPSGRKRTLSLASRTLADAEPIQVLQAAAQAGFDAAGLWVDAARWGASMGAHVRSCLDETGIHVLEVEALTISPDFADADLRRILDIGAEVSARYALVISLDPDMARTRDRFARLCEHAAPLGIRPVLEFMRFTTVRTLQDALAVVQDADHPAGALLVDTLHLARSGGSPGDLRGIDADLFPFAQICDAPARPPGEEPAQLIQEALAGRQLPGHGDLPLLDFLAVFPHAAPLSCEVPSAALRQEHADPVERARAVLDATRALLASAGH